MSNSFFNLKKFVGICALQCFPLFLQAQSFSGYTGSGASVAPVLPPPVPPIELVEPIVPPPRIPPMPPPVIESQAPPNWSRAPLVPGRALDILDFWFGLLPNPVYFPQDKLEIWFADTPEIDRQMRGYFSQDVLNAVRGDYNQWRETPRGRLALILLLDQFPRHIYRNQPQSFMFDRMARALVLEGMQKGDDQQLYPIERAFFYLPLEHSEDLNMQNLSVASYQQLVAQSPMAIKPQMNAFLQYAFIHQQQIALFGRFPARNAILGRESTPEEVVFLNQWGKSSF